MKRKFFGIIGALCAAVLCAAMFAACDSGDTGGGNENNQSGTNTTTTYTVTVESSNYYSRTGGTTKAPAGTEAYVDIEPSFDVVTIDSVFYNGNPCKASTSDENRYEFTMPADDVVITVEYSFTANEKDSPISWNDDNEYEFAATSGTYKLNVDATGYALEVEELFSTNQDVIPNDTLSYDVERDGTIAKSVEVSVDGSQISVGKTQLVLLVNNPNTPSNPQSILVCDITVVDAVTVSVTFTYTNNSTYDDSNITVTLTDNATNVATTIYVTETDGREYFVDNSYTFNYIVGHTYTIRVLYAELKDDGYYDSSTMATLNISTTSGSGYSIKTSSNTGYYTLSVTTEGVTVPITVVSQ